MQIDNVNGATERQAITERLRQQIPRVLQERRQWAVSYGTDRAPFQSLDPSRMARVNDPATWSSFEDALTALERNTSIGSIGYVFSESDPFAVIDVDGEHKVSQENIGLYRQMRGSLPASYTEISGSGTGLHVVMLGTVSDSGPKRPRGIGFEIYSRVRYVRLTGNGGGVITDGQHWIDHFQQHFKKADISDDVTLEVTENGYRKVDWTDDQVLKFAWAEIDGFAERYNKVWTAGCGWDWSELWVRLMGDLDSITGDPEQVRRIVLGSPLVRLSHPKQGETRDNKVRRLWSKEFPRVRAKFNPTKYSPHARILIMDSQLQQAEKIVEGLSESSRRVEGFRQSIAAIIGEAWLQLSRPPGLVSDLCNTLELASWHPSPEYSIPIVLTYLGGLYGRRYKIHGDGLNIQMVVTAPSGGGKTEAMKGLRQLNSHVVQELKQRDISKNWAKYPRLVSGSSASIQGLVLNAFQSSRSLMLDVDESKVQLDSLMNPGDDTQKNNLLAGFLKLYDASQDGIIWHVPWSVNMGRLSVNPIPNLCVSSIMFVPSDTFNNIAAHDLSNGFMARQMMKIDGQYADKKIKHPEFSASANAMEFLVWQYQRAFDLDTIYEGNPSLVMLRGSGLDGWLKHLDIHVDAANLIYALDYKIIEPVKMCASPPRNELPRHWLVVNRFIQNVKRIAGILAVSRDPDVPTVTAADVCWAAGYLIQLLTPLLTGIEKERIGPSANDPQAVVMQLFCRMLLKRNNGKRKKVDMLNRQDLYNGLRGIVPFLNARDGASVLATKTIQEMIKDEIFYYVSEAMGKKATMLKINGDHDIWKRFT
jgi:hypothetical protein